MKKTALAIALTSATAFANAQTVEVKLPTFYGKMNVTQEFVQQENDGSYSRLQSNASRLGLKGDFALNDELTAFYQAEYQIDVDGDADDAKALTMRNTFVGAKGSFGKVQAGLFDTALKAAQGKVDQFNDLPGDIKNIVTNSENREANAVRYSTPSLSGLVLTVDHINAEEEGAHNGLSLSAVYSRDAIYAAVAHDSEVEGEGVSVTRVVGQVSLADLTLGALWETEDDNGESADGFMVSAALKATSKVALKAQLASSDIKAEGSEQMSLGADYKLAKNAKTFVFATMGENDAEDSGVQVYGAGVEYKF